MNFYKTFDSDYLHCGKIDLPWAQVEKDLNSCENESSGNHSLDWHALSFDPEYEYRDALELHKKYGYNQHNTIMWKNTATTPRIVFDWEQQILDQLPLSNGIVAVTRQKPGQILPWHADKFFHLRKLYPTNPAPIWRFLLLLQDWKIGHVLQIKNSIFTHWKQGDIIVWQPNTMHLSANAGIDTKWTCNITGFLTI